MTSPLRKRRRCSDENEDLRVTILSSFRRSGTESGAESGARADGAHHRHFSSFPEPRSAILLESLVCVSSDGGRSGIEKIRRALRDHSLTVGDVASAVFDEDDDDATPLCCATALIESGDLCIGDIWKESLVLKAPSFLQQGSNGCICHGGGTRSFMRFIETVASCGQGQTRDDLLGSLMEPVLVSGPQLLRVGSVPKRFDVVVRVLASVKRADIDPVDKSELVASWIKASLSAPQQDTESACGRPSSMVWSGELKRLCCGDEERALLAFREMEEAVLNELYGCASPIIASRVFVSCFGALMRSGAAKEESSASDLAVNWPRLFLLLRRACDSRQWSDVSGVERQSVESAVHAALCSPDIALAPHLVAVALAVSRHVFRCGRNAESLDDSERGYRNYEKWLHAMSAGLSKAALKSLCVCLADVASVDSARYLEASVKVLTRSQRLREVVDDYLRLARVRLKEINENKAPGCDASSVEAAQAARAAKAVSEVARYVATFSRNSQKMPAALVRLMNFHRYHFRSSLLDVLLSPSLHPGEVFLSEEFPRGGLQEFNRHRVAMIETMAFQRKDKAVTRAEAEPAIAAIRDKILAVDSQRVPCAGGPGRHALDARLSKESSFIDLIRGFSAAMAAESLRPVSLTNAREAEAGCAEIGAILASKLASLVRESIQNMAKVVTNFLESILNAISEQQRGSQFKEDPGASQRASGTETEQRHGSKSVGSRIQSFPIVVAWVREILLRVVGDCRLPKFRRALQHRILVLLCVQLKQVSNAHASALGLFLFALSSLSDEPCLHDFVFVLTSSETKKLEHLLNIVCSNLPLSSQRELARSTLFAVSYLHEVLCKPFCRVSAGISVRLELSSDKGKESASPSASLRHRDEFPIIPCSQSQDGSQFSSGDGASDPSCSLPVGLVQLVRWVTISSWRLLDPEDYSVVSSNYLPAPCHEHEQSVSLEERVELVGRALSTLDVLACANVPFGLTVWTTFELRTGGGDLGRTLDILRRFTCRSSYVETIGQVARLIAEENVDGCSETVQFGSQHAWLILSLALLAKEAPCESGRVACLEDGSLSTYWGVVEFTVLRPGPKPSLVAITLVELLGYISPGLYFNGCSTETVGEHIRCVLVPSCWPFTASSIRSLGEAYTSWLSGMDETNVPASLLTALVLHWDAVEASVGGLRGLEKCLCHDLVSRARDLWNFVKTSLGFHVSCEGCLTESRETQLVPQLSALAKNTPGPTAAVLLYYPLVSLMDSRERLEDFSERLERFLSLLNCEANELLELLALLIEMAGRCCFVGLLRKPSVVASTVYEWGSRVTLLCVGQLMRACDQVRVISPWLLLQQDNKFGALESVLTSMGILGTSAIPSEKASTGELKADSSNEAKFGAERSLLSVIVLARAACALGQLPQPQWRDIVHVHDATGNPTSLLLRVLSIQIELSRAMESAKETSLCGERGYRAVMHRIQRDMYNTVDRCLGEIQGGLDISSVGPELRRWSPAVWQRLVPAL